VTLRSIGDGVIAVDVSGQVVLMNRMAERLTGWSAARRRAGHSVRCVAWWTARRTLP